MNDNYRLITSSYCSRFEKFAEGLEITIRHVDDFLANIYAVVSVDLADLIDGNDIGTVDAQELFRRQHLFYGLHREVGNQRLGLVIEIEHHIVLNTADIGNLIDHDVTSLAIDTDKDGILLW